MIRIKIYTIILLGQSTLYFYVSLKFGMKI